MPAYFSVLRSRRFRKKKSKDRAFSVLSRHNHKTVILKWPFYAVYRKVKTQ